MSLDMIVTSQLIFLNLVANFLGCFFVYRLIKNQIIWLLFFIQTLFYVIKPIIFLTTSIGTNYLSKTVPVEPQIQNYLCIGAVFSFSFYVILFALLKTVGSKIKVCSVAFSINLNKKIRFWLLIIITLTVCYAANAIKYGDYLYPFVAKNPFDAMMQLANNSWYLNVLGDFALLSMLMLLGKYIDKSAVTVFFITLLSTSVYFFIAAPATRSWAVTILLTVIFCRTNRVGFIKIALASIVGLLLLSLLNFARLGTLAKFKESTVVGLAVGVGGDFYQLENSLILIDYFDKNSWYYFKYLPGSATPLVLVPSALFPYKLPVDKEANLTKDVFGDNVSQTFNREGSTLTFTVPVSGYADLGYAGVIVASLIYSVICAVFLAGISVLNKPLVRVISMFLLILTIAGFRLGVEGLLVQTYQYLVIFALFKLFTSINILSNRAQPI